MCTRSRRASPKSRAGKPACAAQVIIGSYAFEDASKTHRFNLQEQGDVMQVAYRGPLPDVFKEGMPVVVEGVVRGDMSIEAREVTAKCPSKYEEGKVSEQAKQRM